ncbi:MULTISPECIES: TetR family transcriptional regulator [unclassified Microbacterium]|uniref:TetR family transcriptional regulator n=1 Tax=unclassified Microbacterium TaxID=2609290 RepID=UPI001605302E|nr:MULTISPECIES: TetR family transcriptional regulator [unclassified Microbacterium]QNA92413.1 TetR family transcriptional regulator [Microbacterium sp. Se63.02b]QYM65706.1 TetR family transcriptional regulator [Microbacterium sp. Se5.02b]
MAEQRKHATRRAELISATRRVAGRSGILGTNVRAVAAEASVSAGSVLYYFSSFDELMYATVEGVLEEMYDRRRSLAEREPDPAKRLVALIVAGVPDEISDHLRMAYESIPLLREQPQYRPLHRSIVERQVALYRSTIEIGTALAAFRPRADIGVIARNIVALEDAYDLYPLIGLELGAETYRANILSYASTALDCPLEP